MDRRVIAFTLALMAAIAIPLCASSGWARGLGVLGLGGGTGATASEWLIEDDFSSNTIANYTEFSTPNEATLAIDYTTTGRAYNSAGGGTVGWYVHSTDLGSDAQVVQAVLCDRVAHTGDYGTGIVLRSDGTSGHGCWINRNNSRIDCNALTSGTSVYRVFSAGAWAEDACHLVQFSVNSSDLYKFEIDFNDDGDFGDTNEQVGTATNSSFSGTKVGLALRGVTGTTSYIDNFKAKTQ